MYSTRTSIWYLPVTVTVTVTFRQRAPSVKRSGVEWTSEVDCGVGEARREAVMRSGREPRRHGDGARAADNGQRARPPGDGAETRRTAYTLVHATSCATVHACIQHSHSLSHSPASPLAHADADADVDACCPACGRRAAHRPHAAVRSSRAHERRP